MPAPDAPFARAGARRPAGPWHWLLLACCLVAAERPRAEAAPRGCLQVPFAQQVDLDTLDALLRAPPPQMPGRVAGLGIDLLRVPSASADRPANPLLAALPVAEASLLRQAGFLDTYDGRAIPAGAACCGRARAAVLIRDTASTYTLLHEVLHLLIVPADGVALHADLQSRFALAFHRLNVYQRRLYDDPARLLEPLWRRDIAQALRDATALVFDRLRIGQSQEAIVEKVLAGCIDERSPYFDDARRAEGRRYGQAMIDNAVAVFATLDSALAFCAAATRQLRDEVAAGRFADVDGASLTAAEHDAFAAELADVRGELARVRAEIDALERFYAR